MAHTLLLVGCGKMGSALLACWKRSFPGTHFHVIAPHHINSNDPRVSWYKNPEALADSFKPDVIVLAVKPQQLESVLPAYRARFTHDPLYLSVAAGKDLRFYAQQLGENARIVRAMPNTPALVGEGMTVLCSSPSLPATARTTATHLMKAAGKVEWLDDESLMDAVTAISGCGPAYVFLFVESLVKAGIAAGLSEPMAKNLAVQTVSGSVALSAQSDKTLEQLRIQVASTGGATEAALAVLMKGDAMQNLLQEAVLAARKRAKELA